MELEDKAEIAALLKKQTNLHIRALTLGGEIYLQQDMMSECLQEYNNAKNLIVLNYASHHPLAKDITQRIQAVYQSIKQRKIEAFEKEQRQVEAQRKQFNDKIAAISSKELKLFDKEDR